MNLDYQTKVLLEERRKQRLQQVRNQEKEIASQKREEYYNRKNERYSSLQDNIRASWSKNHQELINDQNQKFLDSVSAMGNAHLAAEQKILQKESQLAANHENWLQNRQQQVERFEKAMHEVTHSKINVNKKLHSKIEEREKELQHRRARMMQVKEAEKQRASERIKKHQSSQKSDSQIPLKTTQSQRASDKKQSLAMYENTYFHQRIEKTKPSVKESTPSAMEAAKVFMESKEQQSQQNQVKKQELEQKEKQRYQEAASEILHKKEEDQKEKEISKQARIEREKKVKEVVDTAAVISKASQPPPPSKQSWVDTELKKVLENSRQKRKQLLNENFPSKVPSFEEDQLEEFVVVPKSDGMEEKNQSVHKPSTQPQTNRTINQNLFKEEVPVMTEDSPLSPTSASLEKLEDQLEAFERELESRIINHFQTKQEPSKEAWKDPVIPSDRDSLGTSRLSRSSYLALSDDESDIFSISSASPLNLSATDSWVQAPTVKLKSPSKDTFRGTSPSPARRHPEDSLLYSPNTTVDAVSPDIPSNSLPTAFSMRNTRDYRRDDPVFYPEQSRSRSVQDYTNYDTYDAVQKPTIDLDAELARLEEEIHQQKVTQMKPRSPARSPIKFDHLLLQVPSPGARPRTLFSQEDSLSTLPTTQTSLDSEGKFINDSSLQLPEEDKGDVQPQEPVPDTTTEEGSLESSLIDDEDGMSLQQRFELYKKKFESKSKDRQSKIQEKFQATQARRKEAASPVKKKVVPKPTPKPATRPTNTKSSKPSKPVGPSKTRQAQKKKKLK